MTFSTASKSWRHRAVVLAAALSLCAPSPSFADDPCEPSSRGGTAWRTVTGCTGVPLDHRKPVGESLDIYHELSVPAGKSLGKVIVFHGGPGFPRQSLGERGVLWEGLRAHFTVLYFHQRGAGWSGRIADDDQFRGNRGLYTLDAMVADAAILQEQLLGDGEAVLFGKSAGGFLAMKYALKHPDRVSALVLACTSADHRYISQRHTVKEQFITTMAERHPGFTETYNRALEVAAESDFASTEGIVGGLITSDLIDSVLFDLSYMMKGQFEMVAIARDAALGRYGLLIKRLKKGQQTIRTTGFESIAVLNNITCREFGYGNTNPLACQGIEESPRYDIRASLKELTVPSLVISGRYDPILPPRFQQEIAESLGGPVSWKVFDLSAHMVFREQPDATATTVLDFLGIPRQQVPQLPGL